MKLNLDLDPKILALIKIFTQRAKRVYLVGGIIRDSFLGKETFDLDLASPHHLEELEEILIQEKIKVQKTEYANLSFHYEGYHCDLTQFREEGAYDDRRHPSWIAYTGEIEVDLKRRDFTINAMAYHPDTGLIDCFNGYQDLCQGVLRCVGNPWIRFEEDALRLLRLMRFKSQLGFSVEDNTLSAYEGILDSLSQLNWSQKKGEFYKLLGGTYILSVDMRLWQVLFPELESQVHFDLTLLSLLPHDSDLRLSGFFYALKRETGISTVRKYLDLWQFPLKKQNAMLRLIEAIDHPLTLDDIGIHTMLYQHGLAFMQALLKLKKTAYPDAHYELGEIILKDLVKAKVIQSQRDLKINAYDIINLGFKEQEIRGIQTWLAQEIIEKRLKNRRKDLLEKLEERVNHGIH